MPTYHYRCAKCEQHLEIVQSMTDDPITECAACGGTMQKVLQPVGIVLKGSGFYRTDARSGSKPTSKPDTATKSEPSSGKDAKSSGSGADAKPSGSGKDSSSGTSGSKASEAKSA